MKGSRRFGGVLMYTDTGIYLLSWDGVTDSIWSADRCYDYCNREKSQFDKTVASNRLKMRGTLITKNCLLKRKNWFTNKNNFRNTSFTISPKEF